jgi:hypothetical protein
VVVRGEDGNVLTTWRALRWCVPRHSLEKAEAEACLEGLRLVVEWIRAHVIVESDCANLIKTLKTNEVTQAPWAGVIVEVRAVFKLVPYWKLHHIGQKGKTHRSRRAP